MKFETSPPPLQNKNTVPGSWIILLAGLLISTFATFYVHKKNQNEDRLRFTYEKDLFLRRFTNRLESYEGALIQTRAFLLNSPRVNLQQLHNYFQDTELFERFSGLQGLGYSVMLKPQELPHHIQEMKKIMPDYKVWPESERELYSSIIVLEPLNESNNRALGFDMYSEPTRRKAMQRARDENAASISHSVVLVQEGSQSKAPGFLMYLPHYKKGAGLNTVEERRSAIEGFVYTPFRASELFKAITPSVDFYLDVEIYDGPRVDKDKLMYDSHGDDLTIDLMEDTEKFSDYGAEFTLKFKTLASFNKSSSIFKNILVFFICMLITFLLLGLYIIGRRQMNAMSLMALEKEKLLKKEKEHVAARDDFLSIASHELKTPLTSLKLQSQVMMRSIKRQDPEALSLQKVSALIKQIDTQTTRLTRLVDDMLDISRIRTGRLKMEMEEFDVEELLKDVLERLFPPGSKVIPEVRIEDKIWAYWDKFRIEQVLTNLLTNAIRYGNNLPIKIHVAKINDSATISIIDQGIGIAPENIEKIFDRFERAGMSANEVSGLGLGLFITNQIVKAHQGTIKVESELGKGSTFIVTLPLNHQERSGNN